MKQSHVNVEWLKNYCIIIRYGTRNRAFDPDVENDPDALRATSPDNIFSGNIKTTCTLFRALV